MSKGKAVFLAALLMCMTFGLQVMSARLESPTYDEQGHIVRGYAFVKLGDLHIRTGTPILLNALDALPLLTMPDLRLPVDRPSWKGTDFHPISEQFMWQVNDNADQIVFLARIPTMWLTLLLGAFVYRWASELFGRWGGLLALVLYALDPNIIAHGRLATTDLGATAWMFITLYWTWKLLRRPSWLYVWAMGVSLGLAQASKFSALMLGPILALLFGVRALIPLPFALGPREEEAGEKGPWWRRWLALAAAGGAVLIVAYLSLWAVYGFQVGPVPGWTNWPLLAPAHFEQFLDISGRLTGEEGREARAFLMGELYVGGRWAYFPVAFALKTPLPTLILVLGALLLGVGRWIGAVARRSRAPEVGGKPGNMLWVLWLPPLIFFGTSLSSNLNLGYRYILPVLPFLFVLAGCVGQWWVERWHRLGRFRRALLVVVASAIVGWSFWSGLSIYPHYLAYFNECAGGPDNGWHYLVDSNIDWGQDLKGLKRWMDEHGVERVKLGYVGEAYPSYYGIEFDPLPSHPDRWQHPLHHELYPADPAPGLYAISVNLIQGRNVPDPNTYAWFRERQPIAKVGYSIFIYDVPERGPDVPGVPRRAAIVLSDLVLPDICPEDYARLGTNDVRVLWFNEERSLLVPGGDERSYAFIAGTVDVHPALAPLWPWAEGEWLVTCNDRARELYFSAGSAREPFAARVEALADRAPAWHMPSISFVPGDPGDHGERLAYPIQFDERIELLAYEFYREVPGGTTLYPGETLTVVTYWRAGVPDREPIQLFVHLLDQGGTLRGGEDRLDVWYENWHPGDLFVQVQEVPLDEEAAPGVYQVEIGWYYPTTMQRLQVLRDGDAIADRLLLTPVQVPGESSSEDS